MNRTSHTLLLGLPAALVFGAGAAIGSRSGDTFELKDVIAVVDIDRVQLGFPLAIERQNDLEALQETFSRELARLEQAGKARQMEAEGYEKGTPEHDDAIVAAELARHAMEVEREKCATQFRRKQAEYIEEIGRKLRAGIARFAKEKGYQIVLRWRSAAAGLRGQLDSAFVEDIVYHDTALDVTEQVIQFLRAGAGADADK